MYYIDKRGGNIVKKIICILLSCLVGLSFVGCGSTNNDIEAKNSTITKEKTKVATSTSTNSNKETTKKSTYNVDWNKCIEDTKAELLNKENYSYVNDIYIKVDDTEKLITFSVVLSDSTNDKTALSFADTIIRRFSANAQMQDNSIKSGDKNYLGGIYDSYDILIGVAPYSQSKNTKGWYIYDCIGKTVQREPKLQK